MDVLRELGIKTHRTCIIGLTSEPIGDFLQIPTEGFGPKTLEQAKPYIDDAIETKTTSFALFHNIVEGIPTSAEWNKTDFNNLIAYISQTGIKTLTNDEWYNEDVSCLNPLFFYFFLK